MYTLDASLCLPRSWLLRAALLSCKLKLSGSNQSTADNTGLLKIRSYALYPARVYLGVFVLGSGRKELCRGGCHVLCQSWVQYSTFRHWHWYGCMLGVFLFFLIAFVWLVCFTDHTQISLWERKLMMTRHGLGRLVLEIVPPIISMWNVICVLIPSKVFTSNAPA